MKKWMLVLVLAAVALGGVALGAWTEIELEGGADRRAGFLGKVAEIQPAGSNGVAAIRATWTNVSEVVTTQAGTNTTTVTNWYRVKAGTATNGLSVGDFVRPDDLLRVTNGAAWTSVILEL